MALSLFLEWSEDRKDKELSKTRHSSQSSTADAARAQALDAILSRNSQNPSYAFEVVLGKIKPSVDNAVRDGVLLQLAGRFAGPDYIPQGGNSDTLLSFVAKLGEAWLALRPQIFQCVQEVSMSRFDELVKRILEYFRYRAVWAKEDFSGVPELAPVVQRIQQQAEEAEALIKGYRARISDGIKTGQVSIAQAHKCWFDLFYPFCKEYGGGGARRRSNLSASCCTCCTGPAVASASATSCGSGIYSVRAGSAAVRASAAAASYLVG
jgi:hypothetical protein